MTSAVRVAAVLICGVLVSSVSPGQAQVFTLGPYGYDGVGNITTIGTDSYTYDEFGRITWGTAGAGRNERYTYDRWGNLVTITTDDATSPRVTIGVNPATNRASESTGGANAFASYDASTGQVTSYTGGSFTHDAAGMVKQSTIDGVTRVHLYSPSDERIASIVVNQNVETNSEWSFRDTAGRVLRRASRAAGNDSNWTWQEDYIYRDGQLLAAEVPTSAGRLHFHLDHLGTPRLITDRGGREVSRHTYYPFGMEATPRSTAERMKFTGHERDFAAGAGTDLDYMHARLFRPAWGRFLSPDPYPGKQREPQSWNRYAYALNNPLKYTDPTGKYVTSCAANDKQCNADASAFETARQQDLKSKDAAVAAAAQAYGNPGQANGITVGFGNTGTAGGTTTAQLQGNADGTMGMTATVMIKSGLRGTDLNAAIAHEGQHVVDAQGFANSFTKNAAFWDLSKNLTGFQTEMNAYRLTHSIFATAQQKFSTGCNGCTLGGTKPMTPADVDLAIRKILADPSGAYKVTPQNQGQRQFPEWTTPP